VKPEDAPKPPVDAVAWPTPDTAPVDDAKKKTQEKIDGDAQSAHEAKGKQAWNKLEFTPSVLFNTPLPGASRRGGKGGGRGGKGEGSSRTSVSGASERRSESNNGAQSVEGGRRERSDANRSTSPTRAKRNATGDENAARRSSRQESASREAPAKASDEAKSKASEIAEQGQPKNGNITKPRGNRKDEALVNGDRNTQDSSTSKETTTPPANKTTSTDQSAPQPPATTTTAESRKPEAGASSNERKSNNSSEYQARNHERKGSGSYSSFTSRGRGERGRGGRGGRNNGHQFHPTAHSFVNGQNQFAGQNYNGTPKSPTSFGPDAFVGQAPQSNPRYGRNVSSRASSIPTEGTYPRFANGYPNQPLQLNTGVQANGIYPQDYYLPATAIPYQNDPTSDLLNAVTQQMEYYFSIDNLLKDTYLRKHMDSQGFVLLTFIAEFKRLKIISRGDLELIKYVCQQSPNIEHRIGADGVDRLRAAKGWKQWVLPKEDRDPTAQHDGPDSLHHPPRPHPQFLEQPHMLRHSSLPVPQSAGPVLGGQGFQSLNSFAAPYNYPPSASLNSDSPAFNPMQSSPTSMTSGQNLQQSSNTSFGPAPAHTSFFSNGIEETEPDTFTDAEVNTLKVVMRDIPGETGGSSRAASSRTFSNGSAEGVNGLAVATQSPPPEAVASTNE
jgi:la-related protein 1